MSHQNDHDHIAAIHQVPLKEGDDPIARLKSGMGLELMDALIKRGVSPIVTRGLGAYSLDGTVKLWLPTDAETITEHESSWRTFGVIRDIAGGFGGSKVEEVADVVASEIPVINNRAIRQGDDKAFVAEHGVFGDRQARTIVAETGSHRELDSLIGESFESGVIYAKPSRGAGSTDIYRIDLSDPNFREVLKAISSEQAGQKFILQEEIRNRGSLPGEIKPENEEQAALIEAYKDAPKELRLFWFYGRDHELAWMPVLRLTAVKNAGSHKADLSDRYAYIDPDTTPAELVDFTKETLDRFSKTVGASEMSGAFDFAYGLSGSNSDARWWVMEGNFWQPVPPSRKEHPELRSKFVEATAEQMSRIARNRSN